MPRKDKERWYSTINFELKIRISESNVYNLEDGQSTVLQWKLAIFKTDPDKVLWRFEF